MIEEFNTELEMLIINGLMKPFWHSRISIDLTWVSSARTSGVSTLITMAGSGHERHIEIRYEDFMAKWTAAKARG